MSSETINEISTSSLSNEIMSVHQIRESWKFFLHFVILLQYLNDVEKTNYKPWGRMQPWISSNHRRQHTATYMLCYLLTNTLYLVISITAAVDPSLSRRLDRSFRKISISGSLKFKHLELKTDYKIKLIPNWKYSIKSWKWFFM